jgi:hypothetical protein
MDIIVNNGRVINGRHYWMAFEVNIKVIFQITLHNGLRRYYYNN